MMQKKYRLCACEAAIFRAYDIRGVVEQQLNENVYFTLGVALAQILKKNKHDTILLAWDGRLNSPEYATALACGLSTQKVTVVNLGLVPTALMYYATSVTEIVNGLMVTGSHNPKNYNGLKIVLDGHTLVAEEIQDIYRQIQGLNLGQEFSSDHFPMSSLDILPSYIQDIIQRIDLKRPLKIVVDYGHGVGAVVGPKLFSLLGCQVINLFDEVDGHFPQHHPDPTVEKNLQDLKVAVHAHQADLGIAFDGDADRLGVVTPDGEVIWPDRLMMIFAWELLQRKPNVTIVYDVKCSKLLPELIHQFRGHALMSPTGHSIVKGMMKQHQAELAGEMSGHIFFKDRWYGFDDGIYSACRLLEILSQYPNLTTLLSQFPVMPCATAELQIKISDELKFDFMAAIKKKFMSVDAQIIVIDGIRLEFEHGWGLIRASNTSPCLVSRFEAVTEAELKRIQALFRDVILSVDHRLELPF